MIHLDIEKPYTYHELVADVVAAGIDQRRAYMFLASLGVKGKLCRFLNRATLGYDDPVKVAVNDKGEVVLSPKALFMSIDAEALGLDKDTE